jgi:hypothetical protein
VEAALPSVTGQTYYFRQSEIHVAEQLVPEHSASEVQMAIERWKTHTSLLKKSNSNRTDSSR